MSDRLNKSDVSYLFLEDLCLNMAAETEHTFTQDEIDRFAELSGDYNPVHVDSAFADASIFSGRVVHGLCVAGLFSQLIGMRLPGAYAIYEGQLLKFRRPVRPGQKVRARCQIVRLIPQQMRVELRCEAWTGETLVVDGEARVLVPSRSARRGTSSSL